MARGGWIWPGLRLTRGGKPDLEQLRVEVAGYWRRGEDWWTDAEAAEGKVAGDAEYVIWPERSVGR